MSRKNILISSALGLASFIAYLFTMPPSVYTGDSGEIATAVYVWGVAHPTGFPIYIILAKLFSYCLPARIAMQNVAGGQMFEFAYRLNIFSAFVGAATTGVLFSILQKIFTFFPFNKGEGRAGDFWPSIAASLSLAFGFTFWNHATTINVYGITALFFSLAIFILLHWIETKQNQYLHILAAICGLGAGTHLTFLLFFPFALIFLFFKERGLLTFKKTLLFAFIFLAVAALAYGYIPLRSAQLPILNWGDPSNVERFIKYITQGDYADKIGTRSLESWKLMLSELGRIFSREFTWLGLIAAIVGAVIACKKNRAFFYAGLLVIILNIILMGNYGNEQDIFILYRYFLPSFIVMAIFISFALNKFFTDKKYAPIILILPAIIFAAHFSDLNRRDYKLLQTVTQDILDSVPQNSILITSGDTITGALMYEQKVLGKRNDLAIVDDKLYTQTWYLTAKKTEVAAKNFVYKDNLSYLVKENLGRGVYSVSNAISFLKINFDFLPEGLIYKLYGKKDNIDFKDFKNKNFSAWEKYDIVYLQDKSLDNEYFNKELVNIYTGALNNSGAYLVNHGAIDDGILYFQKSLDIRENKNALYNLAGIYNDLGDQEKALEYKKRFDLIK